MRLRDGRRVTRRFYTDAILSQIFDWLGGVLAPDTLHSFRLATHYPRRMIGDDEDERTQTLQALGLCPAAMLFVEEDEEDEVEQASL